MSENSDDILSQFQEFLTAKQEADKQSAADEDFDVEIWDEKGRGIKTKRSHAKTFLQSFGIDLDPEPQKDEGTDTDKSKSKTKPPAKTATSTASSGIARKYFIKPTGK